LWVQAVDETFELPASIVAPGENHFQRLLTAQLQRRSMVRDESERPQGALV